MYYHENITARQAQEMFGDTRRIVETKIKVAYPPNYAAVLAVFPGAAKPGVIFTYGDVVYNPSNIELIPSLAAHEHVHMEQQEKRGPELWWEWYLADKGFRLEQELPAHQAEYEQWCIDNSTRVERRLGLKFMAQRLSGPLYCNMVSFEVAKRMIKGGKHDGRFSACEQE